MLVYICINIDIHICLCCFLWLRHPAARANTCLRGLCRAFSSTVHARANTCCCRLCRAQPSPRRCSLFFPLATTAGSVGQDAEGKRERGEGGDIEGIPQGYTSRIRSCTLKPIGPPTPRPSPHASLRPPLLFCTHRHHHPTTLAIIATTDLLGASLSIILYTWRSLYMAELLERTPSAEGYVERLPCRLVFSSPGLCDCTVNRSTSLTSGRFAAPFLLAWQLFEPCSCTWLCCYVHRYCYMRLYS